MARDLTEFVKKLPTADGRCLLVVAAPSEARAVLAAFGQQPDTALELWKSRRVHPVFDLMISGVGKSNAAGSTASALAVSRCAAVVNLGICGSLPGSARAMVGAAVLASASVLVDEGIETPGGWQSMAECGFPAGAEGDAVFPDSGLVEILAPLASRIGPIATVSTCSGTDARAQETARRAGPNAVAEAMEGAAVGLAARRFGVPFAEMRVVSNRTGDRARQGWDLPVALAELGRIVGALAG